MMTTVHLFKNHPNKENIKFIVLPLVRGVLRCTHGVAMESEKLMELFGEGNPAACGLKFDFSQMFAYGVPELWQVWTLANINRQKELLQKIEATSLKDRTKTNVIDVLNDELPKHKPQFERPNDLLLRKAAIDEFLFRFKDNNPLDGKKNAIISHSMTIGALTSDGIDADDRHGLKNYAWI